MAKKIFVVFNEDGARVIKNPAHPEELRKLSNVAESPDLSAVYGIAPHNWQLVDGRVIPKEGHVRSAGHRPPPIIEAPPAPVIEPVKEEKKQINWKLIAMTAIGALIGILIRSI